MVQKCTLLTAQDITATINHPFGFSKFIFRRIQLMLMKKAIQNQIRVKIIFLAYSNMNTIIPTLLQFSQKFSGV